MSKIEVEYEELFSYGGIFSDLIISKTTYIYPTNDNYIEYRLMIVSEASYDSILDCIEYYYHLKEKLAEWLEQKNTPKTKISNTNYTSYPIEIYKRCNIEDAPTGYTVYIGDLRVDELYDTYWAMEGIINQLKTIKI